MLTIQTAPLLGVIDTIAGLSPAWAKGVVRPKESGKKMRFSPTVVQTYLYIIYKCIWSSLKPSQGN